jgi:hypothetical protein
MVSLYDTEEGASVKAELDRVAVTIRVPPETMTRARSALVDGESFNALVIEAIEREVGRRQVMGAVIAAAAFRSRTAQRRGRAESSTQLVRRLREGSGRTDG